LGAKDDLFAFRRVCDSGFCAPGTGAGREICHGQANRRARGDPVSLSGQNPATTLEHTSIADVAAALDEKRRQLEKPKKGKRSATKKK
jgi:hypothetical protein